MGVSASVMARWVNSMILCSVSKVGITSPPHRGQSLPQPLPDPVGTSAPHSTTAKLPFNSARTAHAYQGTRGRWGGLHELSLETATARCTPWAVAVPTLLSEEESSFALPEGAGKQGTRRWNAD